MTQDQKIVLRGFAAFLLVKAAVLATTLYANKVVRDTTNKIDPSRLVRPVTVDYETSKVVGYTEPQI